MIFTMALFGLRKYQLEAIEKMKTGCILCGGVGSGKSRASLAYYYKTQGGNLYSSEYQILKDPKDLYIITTARKRDTLEWIEELVPFLLAPFDECRPYHNNVVIDSWNNIKKYVEVKNAFFIFDEDRVTGSGAWVKAFLKIVKFNEWIILSATPGDTWSDYLPVFMANGFFQRKGDFYREHCIWNRFTKYPKIEKYYNTGKLMRFRNDILIPMEFERRTVQHHEDIWTQYDISKYKEIVKLRWDPWKNAPIESASEYCYALRKVVNSDISRQIAFMELLEDHPKVIVFYSFDYELDILHGLLDNIKGLIVHEWNGHKHEETPIGSNWVYLVNYSSGAEAWNCITTDTIIFYSQTYSYKVLVQACGRIDRMNTPFEDLYYYHLRSRSGIDLAITNALRNKKKFNEDKFAFKKF